uniref:DUF7870 domain-containing protein n=1 Tax=Davidia involucrata TaxID=16924 RepID=A0A5B7APW5_DAVIN
MRCIAMDLVHGFRSKSHNNKEKNNLNHHAHTHLLIISLPNSWVLKLMARLVLLAFVIVMCPSLGSIITGLISNLQVACNSDASFEYSLNVELLPFLFRDLTNEGLLKMGDRALFISSGNNEEAIYNSQILSDNDQMDLISYSDSDRQSSIPDETYDFAFVHGFHAAADFIDRTLKVGGIAAVQLSEDPPSVAALRKPSNYKIVYLRRYEYSTTVVVAMRKTSYANSPTKRRLFGVAISEAKKAALKNLEDVLLEPPRAASGKSKRYLKRTRYLPDLMGDSLESYPRRVFIDVGLPEAGGGDHAGWFAKHYPTRNKDFEIYKIETAVATTEESTGREVMPQIGMSDWLRKNVKEDEYVVMKAEAEVVEEMVKSKAIGLVDELFLECKHQGLSGKNKSKRSRRAYWECLALYGKLRDEGVAVHQWWG